MKILETDWLHKALKFVSYNRGLCTWLVLAVLSVGFASCAVKTPSIVNSTVKVNQVAFESEVATVGAEIEAQWQAYISKVEIGRADIERQLELRRKVFGLVQTGAVIASKAAVAAGVPQPLADMSVGLFGVLGMAGAVGLGVDNYRKRKVLAKK